MQMSVPYIERWVRTADGLKLYVRDYLQEAPARIPLFCVSGFWRNSRDFEIIAPILAKHRRVIAPDPRGRGLSEYASKATQYRFETIVADSWETLDTLGINKVVVLGGAMGGLIAIEMATKQPSRILGIIFNDVGPERAEVASVRMRRFSNADRMTRSEVIDHVREQNKEFFPYFGEEEWIQMVERGYRQGADGLYARDFDPKIHEATQELRERRTDFWREYSDLPDIPLTILRGKFSDYLPESIVKRMLSIKPHLNIITVRDRGHPPLLDEPESIAAINKTLHEADKQEKKYI